jgi:hypothetical protein
MQSETLLITPEMAEKWLEGQALNRSLRRGVVNRYARDMAANKWHQSGEAIKFNGNGKLIDGQHRLAGCVKAKTPFKSLVVTNLDSEGAHVLDTGARRTAADHMTLAGIPSSALAAGVCSWACKYGADQLENRQYQVSIGEILGLYEKYADRIDASVAMGYRLKAIASSSHIGFLRFMIGDTIQANEFFDDIYTGANLAADNPALKFRNLSMANKSSKTIKKYPPHMMLALLIKAWNSYSNGIPMQILRMVRYGKKPESFPMIDNSQLNRNDIL